MKNPLVFVVLPLVLTGVLMSSAFGIGGARSAESGHGDRGTFTAEDCTSQKFGTHMGLLYAIMLPLSGCGLLAWLLWAVGFARVFIPEVREDPWADHDEPGT